MESILKLIKIKRKHRLSDQRISDLLEETRWKVNNWITGRTKCPAGVADKLEQALKEINNV